MRSALSLALLLAAAPASAQCISSARCMCEAQAQTLVRGHVTATSGAQTTVAVDSVVAPADGGSPETLDLPADEGDEPGRQVLVGIDGARIAGRLDIDADGTVTCRFVTPASHVPLASVVAALQASDCVAALDRSGFQEPPCDDTRSCASSPGLSALAMALAVRVLRSQRPRPRK